MSTNPATFLRTENIRLQNENEQLRGELRSLREFFQVLNELWGHQSEIKNDTDLLPMLNRVFRKTLSLLNAPDGSLMILDDETNELVFLLVQGELGDSLKGYRIPATEGIAGWVIRNQKPALVRDVRLDMRFSHLIDDAFKFKTQSILAAPIIGDGKIKGIIEVLNQPGDDPFSDTDLALLSTLCRAVGERLADIERGN